MKIISYNVNGIRAAIAKGFIEWLQHANPDVICLQEIKASEDQVPVSDFEKAGYSYQYYYPATKKGYSGVAVLSKIKPNNIVFGTGIAHMDFEGRNLRVDFDTFSVMSLYLPSGTNEARLGYKFDIHDPIRNAKVSGFLPEERAWLDKFMKNGFIDSFRFFNKQPDQFSWWSYRAGSRGNNKGWRIDYCLVSESLKDKLKRAVILQEAKHSDHCPVLVELE